MYTTLNIAVARKKPDLAIISKNQEMQSTSSFLNTEYNERPLKTNSKNFSFKGLSLGRVNTPFKLKDVNEAIDHYGHTFGKTAREKAQSILNDVLGKRFVDIEGADDQLIFKDKTVLKNMADSALAPFKEIPVDVAHYFVGLLNKVGFNKTKFGQKVNNFTVFVDRENDLQHLADVRALRGIIDCFNENKNALFKQGHDRLDPLKANYSSDAERSLTRFVTGMTSAFFLANDAYNLSRVIKDDPDMAKKDKRKRFKQEVGRVALTSYLTLFTLGSMSKMINKSAWSATLAVVGSCAAAEFLGRLFAGIPILPVNEAKAKKLAAKKNKNKKNLEISENNNANKTSDSSKQKQSSNEHISQIFKNLNLKKAAEIFTVAAGAGIILKTIPSSKKFTDFIDSITKKEIKYTQKEMDTLLDKLRINGFDELAQTYLHLFKPDAKGSINLGKANKKFFGPITELLSFPFNYIYKKILLWPANVVEKGRKMIFERKQKKITNFIKKEIRSLDIKSSTKDHTKILKEKVESAFGKDTLVEFVDKTISKELSEKDKDLKKTLRNAIKLIEKTDDEDIKKVVAENIFYAMDTGGKSNYSNADLAVSCKMWSSFITSFFLVADHYNLVMVNSEGKDKKQAVQKAKERTLQRMVSVFYSSFMLKISNGFLRNIYNASLPGTVAVNTSTQTAMEVLTRKSIGMPVGENTRVGIQEMEQKNREAGGFKGKYFRLMSFLTGKKNLSDRQNTKADNK